MPFRENGTIPSTNKKFDRLFFNAPYANGEGVPQNMEEAVTWFRKAAEPAGHVDAQYHLGVSYLYGAGVPQNKDEAVKWLRKAAAQRHEQAIAILQSIKP